jgi:hypothetical protein
MATDAASPYVVPITFAILVSLFLAQRHGTAVIGRIFGPVMIVWFSTIGFLGLREILAQPGILAAIEMIRGLTDEAEEGKLYMGTVKKIMEFGAFVEIMPGTDGLVHISELDETRVKNVTDILKEGDKVLVKCIGVDKQGKIKLSRKAALGQSLEEKD